jgi:hypothetical protein
MTQAMYRCCPARQLRGVSSPQRLTYHNIVSNSWKSLLSFPLTLPVWSIEVASQWLKGISHANSVSPSLSAIAPLIAQRGGQQVLPFAASGVARVVSVFFRLILVTSEHAPQGWDEGTGQSQHKGKRQQQESRPQLHKGTTPKYQPQPPQQTRHTERIISR